ncbi:MAG: ATP-binding protein [Sporichthyaceae bacterium]
MSSPGDRVAPELRARGVTAREAEVLLAVAERLTNPEIAARLVISVRTVETHVGALMAKLGASSRLALTELGRTLGAGWVASAAVPRALAATRHAPFVGREAELGRLHRTWTAACAGQPQVALVCGEAGIGTTRLAAELAAEVHPTGALVLYGRCDETLAVPFDAVAEAVGAYLEAIPTEAIRAQAGAFLPELARLVPSLRARLPELSDPRSGGSEANRHALFETVRTMLEHASGAAPVLVILDDLHWAGEPTLLLIRHLARAASRARVLVLGTYRDTEPGPLLPGVLGDLRRDTGALTRVSLAGLAAAELDALVRATAGAHPEPDRLVHTVQTGSNGNPFFAVQLLDHLMESAARPAHEILVPEAVREVVVRRVARLAEPVGRALRVAAVLGAEFDVDLLGQVCGLDPEELLDALDAALAARLVVETAQPGRTAFVHALVRRTLLEQLSGARRRHLFASAAGALERLPPEQVRVRAAEIAHHLLAAADESKAPRALHHLVVAAETAIGSAAFEDALAHLERAGRLAAPSDHHRRGSLAFARGRSLRSLGRFAEAIEAWDDARVEFSAAGDRDGTARAGLAKGMDLMHHGDLEPARETLVQALEVVGPQAGEGRAHLLSGIGLLDAMVGNLVSGDAEFAAAAEVAATLANPAVSAAVDVARCVACHGSMRAAEVVESGLRAARTLRAAGDLWALTDALCVTGWNLIGQGRFAESDEVFDEFVPLAHRVAHPWALFIEHRGAGQREFCRSGDLAQLTATAQADIDVGNLTVGGQWNAWAYGWLGTAHFLGGDWPAAEHWLRLGVETASLPAFDGCCTASLFLFLAHTGCRADALAILERHRGELPRPGRPNNIGSWALLFAFTDGLHVLGEQVQQAGWYSTILEALADTGSVMPLFAPGQLVQRVAGVAAAAERDWDAAEAHFAIALAQADELPHRFEQLETRRCYAAMLAERGARGDAELRHRLLREAADGYGRLLMPAHRDLTLRHLAAAEPRNEPLHLTR